MLSRAPILKRLYWKGLKAFGRQKKAWDQQYQEKIWERDGASPYLLELISKIGPKSIIEFGCGSGVLANRIDCRYAGFDISAVAIRKAQEKNAHLSNCSFFQLDMRDWKGATNIDLIVLEESLYYLKSPEIVRFLTSCFKSLTADGSVVVVAHDFRKHRRMLELCMKFRTISQLHRIGERCFLILR